MSCVNMKNIIKKIALFWATIAPGIFLVGYNIGTGSITTMASAGASYGMTLTWALALSCLFTYVLIIAFSRYTCLLYTSPSPRDMRRSRMPSSA